MTGRSRLQFKIIGMDCAEEVAVLKRAVGPVVGGDDKLAFDILNARMTVAECDEDRSDEVVAAVARTGMRAEPWSSEPGAADEEGLWIRHGRTLTTAMSGVLLALGFLWSAYAGGGFAAAFRHDLPVASKVLYLMAALSAGWFVLPRAWFALRRFSPDMNLLMTVAVAGAIGIGEWFEAGAVYFLFSVSLLLESWSVGRARRAVEALLDLTPAVVHVIDSSGAIRDTSPEQTSPGTKFRVRPGERIPLDGAVLAGVSEVNQAPITGESRPVDKEPGSEVFAGAINGDGTLDVVSSKPADETTLARIIRLVSEAQSRRAPAERWVERFARVYTPAVLVLAIVVFLGPPLLLGGLWSEWLYRALVLLVISCPCALVISTPVSIVAGLAASARNGVLIKGGAYLEAPARIRAIAFDKTGTLTEGRPRVVRVVPFNGHSEDELLERAAALEAHSGHPLARAIVEHAEGRGVGVGEVTDFQILQGKGAFGRFDGREFWLGSHRYLEERGQETPEAHAQAVELSRAGASVVAVGNESHVCGLIALSDTIRPEAASVISELRSLGIRSVVMLTGDNAETAASIAQATGVDEFHAELLPEDKVRLVEELVRKHGSAAMAGDGVNDAPAMARASIGIAMGAAGSDAAIEAADIALMSDDLSKLPWLIRHSRRTLAIIQQNIVASIAIKAVFVILTFAGYASLWAAIAADMGVSFLVIFNALRLLRSRGASNEQD